MSTKAISNAIRLLAGAMGVAVATGCGGAPGEDIGQSSEADSLHEAVAITTISYAPNSFVIGNAYPGWHDEVQGNPQFASGPGNPRGVDYRWGFLYGEGFDHCAWIDNAAAVGSGSSPGAKCGSPQQIDTPYFLSTYTDGIHNGLVGDGSLTHMHYAGSGCSDHGGYGNVEPWLVPATPHNPLSSGPVPDGKELLWRYVSRDGDWVLVRDPQPGAGDPNWYFVHRGCVSLANTQ